MRTPFPSIVRLLTCVMLAVAFFMQAEALLACSVCGCCRVPEDGGAGAASIGDVIVSEIMYNPAGSDRPDGFNKEWIELYNTTGNFVSLADWSIGDSQDNHWVSPFPSQFTLAPYEALVITGDAATFDNHWGPGINRFEVSGFPTLANSPSPTNETVAIRDASGTIIDAVNYDDASGWPRINGSNGASIFARPQGLAWRANDLGTNWAPSSWGGYGAVLSTFNGELNHASPGFVATTTEEPFTPSADAAWSMVVLPDTQNYSKASINAPIFTQMTEWARDNKDAFNIQVVLHEGDIVNNNNNGGATSSNLASPQQWQNAQSSMHVLNGHVPYIMAAGNHDFGTTNAQNRQTFFNDYFKATDNPLVDPAQGGILQDTMNEGELQNAYYEFTAPDGREMLIFSLEWEPRPETVAWANEVAGRAEYTEHTAVLLTHAFLRGNNTRYSNSRVPEDASGQELWTELVRPNENFEMVFNGHFGGDGEGHLGTSVVGHVVHQMFFNTQFETQGGNGWIRVIEFLEDGTTVRVRTYSPYLGLTRTHPDFQYEFQISPLPSEMLAGDFNEDGVVDTADYTVWRDGLGGEYTQDDYETWKVNFGATLGESSGDLLASVPEPDIEALIFIAAIVFATIATKSPAQHSRDQRRQNH